MEGKGKFKKFIFNNWFFLCVWGKFRLNLLNRVEPSRARSRFDVVLSVSRTSGLLCSASHGWSVSQHVPLFFPVLHCAMAIGS